MTSQPKQRRKKALEPLDWRELAEGPALRGLTEVLATPPEVARQRASQRAQVDIEVQPDSVGETSVSVEGRGASTEGVSPTVGIPEVEAADFPAPLGYTQAAPPAVVETPSAIVSPTVGDIPTDQGSLGSLLQPVSDIYLRVVPELSVVDSPAEVVCPTEDKPPTEVVTPSVGATPTDQLASAELAIKTRLPKRTHVRGSATPSHYLATGLPPTVGVSPSVNHHWWVDSAGTRYESKRVQRVVIAQHSMSLGEERVYQTLWHGRESDGIFIETKKSKTFSLGYDRMARLVRLNEKSVRVLLPKLINKKILEVVAAENSASRLGRTYRIFNCEEILERQRAVNLTNVVKNGRAVEFVWPEGATVDETTTVGGTAAR
jgi:hypothetical protein